MLPTLILVLARTTTATTKNIKISKNCLKIKGRGESFLGKIILKIWGLCLPFLNRVVFVFFFDKFCYKQNLSKNEVLHEKRKYKPFRRLYAD